MGYASKETEISYDILFNHGSRDDGSKSSAKLDRTNTDRTDNFDNASPTALDPIVDLLPEVVGTILTVPHEAAQSGDVLTWSVSGTGSTDFVISTKGELSRAAEVTLNGPYSLTIRATTGAPLYRSQEWTVSLDTQD